MAKRFCKLNRRDIIANLGEIHSLVTEPKYLCRSCARSSSSKSSLCKPAAIPPASCQNKPLEQQKECGLLAEALALSATENQVKEESIVVESLAVDPQESLTQQAAPVNKKVLKKAKKTAKKQKKHLKKLNKVFKKQRKLLNKQKKLEGKFQAINQRIAFLQQNGVDVSTSQPSVH
ncbi:hypothetical protein [Vibrio sonorensis]|uniref:hypothetical protein n=1 Tax=Vibrio sonorensis TaxID=1004316 RepID=UPI0008D94A73|nr:hypothetical protein [Vibrio sonorensis]